MARRSSPAPRPAAGRTERRQVAIVGAGPVGLSLAIDLALRGIPAVVLEAETKSAEVAARFGSRSICYAKRSLEILDRLGVGQAMLDKGVTWRLGKVFWRDRLVYQFDLLPEAGHRMPAFVNCQQFYVEQFLVERARELGIEIRWSHKVTGCRPEPEGVLLEVETADGGYGLTCDWLLACDGARSTVRRALGLAFEGQVFKDRFLITDVVMQADYPPERWFWFDPPFHPGQSALLHSQPDHVWRIDLQLGWDADPELEVKPERVVPRLKAMLGDRRFEVQWTSIYTFQCRMLRRFRHNRIIFLGDAAHQVSPFGARGCNSGMQDADNLAWKLALVLRGLAPERLLDSYDEERLVAAEENVRHSSRSTEFITPKNQASRTWRDAVLALAERHPFARRMINSGRLSTPTHLGFSSLNTEDDPGFASGPGPGSPCPDAPLQKDGQPCWVLNQLSPHFTLLVFLERAAQLGAGQGRALAALAKDTLPVETLVIVAERPRRAAIHGPPCLHDVEGLAVRRYDAMPGAVYLVRPDQHVTARWRRLDLAALREAINRAIGAAEPAALSLAGE